MLLFIIGEIIRTAALRNIRFGMTLERPVALPTEIIFEILLRLPVESLLRCKSVCKLWLSLISSPYFINSHLKLSSTTNAHRRIIFTNFHDEIHLKSCPLNDVVFEKSVVNTLDDLCLSSTLYAEIVGSCNGLVCAVRFQYKRDVLFIWNPSTKISTRSYYTFSSVRYNMVYGFAYDKDTDDYKIVGISWPDDRFQAINQIKVKIYSLKAGNWKQIGDFPHGYPVNMPAVFSNGFLHWMATPTPRGDNGPTYPCTIVSLDLANETYGEVSQPVYDEGDKVLTLGALGEWLCVLCSYRVLTRADVWVMKVYGVQDSWTKLASVTYPASIYSPDYRPLFVSNDGTILLQKAWDLVVYDSNDGSCSKIENFDGCTDATIFVESLVSPYLPVSP